MMDDHSPYLTWCNLTAQVWFCMFFPGRVICVSEKNEYFTIFSYQIYIWPFFAILNYQRVHVLGCYTIDIDETILRELRFRTSDTRFRLEVQAMGYARV